MSSNNTVTDKLIGTGIKAYTSDAEAVGTIRFLDSPEEVLDFIDGPDVTNTVVISRGGTTTFMSPALMAGVAGLITLQGAPESHLGILSREFGIPCVMSTEFTEGIQTSRGETIPADGAKVRLAIGGEHGQVYLLEN
ncbi:PEP-utilizing enzyme [Rhodococcus sp. USK13]|jgi:signal transduction protein with GAF and PtsI domain|uniref:PEP-utilizing enzyme n=1 Tax=Rhodococcus sp. USK13 TaxID=2806442 RepID=UPI001BD0F464|nr:PEP-utilizing enzyme [Rhodococcus sp. USK13]